MDRLDPGADDGGMKFWTPKTANLPPHSQVTLEEQKPRYKWACTACTVSKRFYQRPVAEEFAWDHYPCDAVDPTPPLTLEQMGLERTFGET